MSYTIQNRGNRLVVLWRVTSTCNLGCHFCGYSKFLKRPNLNAAEEEVHNFMSLLGSYSREFDRDVLVTWLGGEPFLWPPLLGISRACKTQFGLKTGVTTNGQPLGREALRQQVVDIFDEVTISIDGIGSTHDRLRNEAGLFESLKQNIIRIRDDKFRAGKGPLIRVNTILTRGTVSLFEDLCLEISRWGVEEITFNQLGGNERPEFYPDNCLTREQVDSFNNRLPIIRERLASLGVTIPGSKSYLERILYTVIGSKIPVADCSPGKEFLFIDEYGKVSPCSFTCNEYGVNLSDLKSISDIAGLPERYCRLRIEKSAAPCGDCHSTQFFGKYERVLDSLPH
jgi:AdoMet-dependent heme synthase